MQKCSRILITVICFGLISNLYAAGKTDDIRILIDVSGSMKESDPSGHRISALKMFNGLLAEGSIAGVWTIDRFVEMVVNLDTVNDQWRKAADTGVSTIHSDGIYTNIESGLSRASLGWEEADADTRRSIILVTDGSANISDDALSNQVSRQNIISKNLQSLKQSGVVIHTIALSNNADESLLKKLSLDTGGSFQKVEFSADLQRAIFRAFERTTQPDSVKLTENQFTIDRNVGEMTLLIFRQKHSAPTLLYPPGSSPLSSKKPGDTVWRSDSGYDLVTIKNPPFGVWTIDAETDPDNRLMVETDLKLNLTGFVPYLMPSQPIELNVELHDQDSKVKEASLLQFVDFSVTHIGIDGLKKVSKLEPARAAADRGQYSYNLEDRLEEGTHSFVISADSGIFNRSRRFVIEVQWPVMVKIDPRGNPGNYQLTIKPREEYFNQASLRPGIVLQAPDGNRQDLALTQVNDEWHAEIETGQEGVYQAFVKIDSGSPDKEAVSYDLGGYPVIGVFRQPPLQDDEIESTIATEPVLSTVVESDSIVESDSMSESKLAVETAAAPEISRLDRQPDWTRVSIELAVINLVFIIMAAGVWLFLRDEKDEAGLRLVEASGNV